MVDRTSNPRMIAARKKAADERLNRAVKKVRANPHWDMPPFPWPRDPALREALQAEWVADLLEKVAAHNEQGR